MSYEMREQILTLEEPYKDEITIKCVDLKGDFEHENETLETLKKELLEGFENSQRFIFFNLSQVSVIGEAFWILCMTLLKKSYEYEGCFKLTNATSVAVNSLRHFRLQNIFELHGSESKALRVLETELKSQMIPFN